MKAKAKRASTANATATGALERKDLLQTLKARFETHMQRHEALEWQDVEARLNARPAAVRSLQQMEGTGGEPDVVGQNEQTGEFLFVDCSAESPAGRRSVCYDAAALASRREHKPKDSAQGMAAAMGVQILTEDQYRALQRLGVFDTKTSSWLRTPAAIRKLGGALFGDRRYDTVFVYHNGAESYYAARGFRAALKV
jgi:hypothetical protein